MTHVRRSSNDVTIIPFKGIEYITSDPQQALKCVHCQQYSNEPSLFVVQRFNKENVGDVSEHTVENGPTLVNQSSLVLLHLNCFVPYNVDKESRLLEHIKLPLRCTPEIQEVPVYLLNNHHYLREIAKEYIAVTEGFRIFCSATRTNPANPAYRMRVPRLPTTPIEDRRLWSNRFIENLFGVFHYIDIEVKLRNSRDTTNFHTFYNQLLALFEKDVIKSDDCYIWWHDLKQYSRDRHLFRLVFFYRPILTDDYINIFKQRPGATWNDFVGTYSVKTADRLNTAHDVAAFQQNAAQDRIHTVALLINRYSENDDFNVRQTQEAVVPLAVFEEAQANNSIRCSFNSYIDDSNKEHIRCFLIESPSGNNTLPTTIIPFMGTYAESLSVTYDTLKEFQHEYSTLEPDQIVLLQKPNITLLR